jgi:hypothetical protein
MPGGYRRGRGRILAPAMRVLAPDTGPLPLRVVRWTARAGAVISLALLVAFATSGGEWPTPEEWLLMACFPAGVALGTALSWRHEVLGGGIAAASLAGFYALYLAISGGRWPGAWFMAFAAPALALLGCGLWSRAELRGRRPSSPGARPGPRRP